MKRFLFIIIGVLVSMSCVYVKSQSTSTSTSTQHSVSLEFHKKANSTKVHRTPLHIPIDVFYDDVDHTLIVSSDEDLECEVYLYNSNYSVVDYSSCGDTIFTINMTGTYTVQVNGDDWYVIGTFTVLALD
jgi:hypothetical protein